ncbi:hypothetical protein GYMLUDRAFT_65026 [Collybiopsis luxurians FD-317 M1]|uniref:Uncharacterized protein n=1 Tax=Collybiopsis luxurians FD-317 M1 TaxID=944289 RepID=A0A0D0C8J1_9AGAR|nr:hypothetical protein GYMLUDRAFT_65026 [Collybiopsis luxurians FD-317 M1]
MSAWERDKLPIVDGIESECALRPRSRHPSPVDSGLHFPHAFFGRRDFSYVRKALNIRESMRKGKVQGFFSGKEHFMDWLSEALGVKKQGVKHKLDPLGAPSAYNEKAIEAGIFALKQSLEANMHGGSEGDHQRQVNQDLEDREKRVAIKEKALHARETSVVAREANIAAREASIATREAGIAVREKNVTARERNIMAREKSKTAKEKNLLPGQHRSGSDMN